MSQPTSPFVQGLPRNNPFTKAIKSMSPSVATTPVQASTHSTKKRYNPFLTALNADTPEFKDMYGVNRPLEKAMFLGYKDDKPIYGGSRLFILY